LLLRFCAGLTGASTIEGSRGSIDYLGGQGFRFCSSRLLSEELPDEAASPSTPSKQVIAQTRPAKAEFDCPSSIVPGNNRPVAALPFGQLLEEELMRIAIALAAAAGICFAVPTANAEETRVGVGVGPVGAGVTVGESHDRDRDRDRTTVIKRESEPREHTTVIKKEHEEPSSKVIVKQHDRD
jgi:hypothetical protein